MKLDFWEAVATVVGTIIGAGIFGIPYVVAKAGFLTGAIVIFVLGFVVLMLYLYLGEIVLRTKGKHQLTGYCEKYLGKWGKRVMFFSMIFGIYGALIAYLIGEGAALSTIFGGQPTIYSLIFFVVASTLLYFGLEALEKSELVSVFIVLIIVATIIIFTAPHVNTQNLIAFDITKFFVPFGVVLFAYLGLIAVPEANEILEKDKGRMKKVLFIGVVIPIIVYFIFTLVVVGSIGLDRFEMLGENQRMATIALGEVIGTKLFIFANIFAIFAMFTSFIAIGYALKEMFMYDYNLSKTTSWALTCFVPLVIALSGFTNFIQAINISGVVAGGIDAILILLMFHKAKHVGDRKPEYSLKENKLFSVFIGILFIAGAVFVLL